MEKVYIVKSTIEHCYDSDYDYFVEDSIKAIFESEDGALGYIYSLISAEKEKTADAWKSCYHTIDIEPAEDGKIVPYYDDGANRKYYAICEMELLP